MLEIDPVAGTHLGHPPGQAGEQLAAKIGLATVLVPADERSKKRAKIGWLTCSVTALNAS